jgi:plasmid stabilization system protein ParE
VNYEFHPDAEIELLNYAKRYETEVPVLDKRFRDEIEGIVELLLESPGIGSVLQGEIRHFVLRRFPHAVIYAIIGDSLYVLAVAHGYREPGYWTKRSERKRAIADSRITPRNTMKWIPNPAFR